MAANSITANVHLSDGDAISVSTLHVDHSRGPIDYVQISMSAGVCIIATQDAAVALYDKLSAFLGAMTHADFGGVGLVDVAEEIGRGAK